ARELHRRFLRRRSRRSEAARLQPCLGRTLCEAGFGKMLRQQLRLSGRRLGIVLLDRVGDPGMELLAAALQQAVMCGVLYQRMFESVSRLGGAAAPEDQSGSFELRQCLTQLSVGQSCYSGQQLVIKLPADG